MGEHVYTTNGVGIRFSTEDDEFGCLCTFPHNYEPGPLDNDTVRSLALLGAAVALARNSPYFAEQQMDHREVYLPYDLPRWVVDGIRKALPIKEEDA